MNQTHTEIYNYKEWITEITPAVLRETLEDFLNASNYTVLNFMEHYFPVQGYTCIWLLGESHLAVHTFPEHGEAYIELSGCNKLMNDAFVDLFEERFTKSRIETQCLGDISFSNN